MLMYSSPCHTPTSPMTSPSQWSQTSFSTVTSVGDHPRLDERTLPENGLAVYSKKQGGTVDVAFILHFFLFMTPTGSRGMFRSCLEDIMTFTVGDLVQHEVAHFLYNEENEDYTEANDTVKKYICGLVRGTRNNRVDVIWLSAGGNCDCHPSGALRSLA